MIRKFFFATSDTPPPAEPPPILAALSLATKIEALALQQILQVIAKDPFTQFLCDLE